MQRGDVRGARSVGQGRLALGVGREWGKVEEPRQ